MIETGRSFPTDQEPTVEPQTLRFGSRQTKLGAVVALCSILGWLSPTSLHGAAPEACKDFVDRKQQCKDLLPDLEDLFRQGKFDEIASRKLHRCCLKRRGLPSRHWLNHDERITAFQLLAETQIMLDDIAMARVRVSELLRTDPDFNRQSDLPEFQRLVKEESSAPGFVSASGIEESPWRAPATAVVVDAEQIELRGYLDLESVLHDLPGFDISRGNGLTYSNLYQRGFRSKASDRFLFLVDGVEQNDLHSNIAYLSRQYPIDTVDRIEVLYGPASSIYGTNAYTGVIQVITRRPADLVPKGDKISARLQLVSGSFDSQAVEFTVAGRAGGSQREDRRVGWSLTGRRFDSNEPDLSTLADWNFALDRGPEGYKNLLRLTGDEARRFDLDRCHGFCERGVSGGMPTVELTDLGAAEAARLDRLGYTSQRLGGAPIGFSDETKDTFLSGRLDIQDLSIGFQLWRREEGTAPWYTDRFRPGRQNGSVWIPRSLSTFLDYDRSLGRSLDFSLRARFTRHDLDPESSVALLRSYDNGALDLEDLLALGGDGALESAEPFWQRQQLEQLSTQARGELRLVFRPSRWFELITGLEVRNSSIQGDFTRSTRECSLSATECGHGPDRPGPIFGPTFLEREKLTYTDVGFYAQAAYVWGNFEFTVGSRIDETSAQEEEQRFSLFPLGTCEDDRCLADGSPDYGSLVSPRFAAVYTSGEWVAKAVYSEGFRNPSSFERLTTDQDRLFRNPGLEPERARNVELAVGWRREDLRVEAAVYEASYRRIVTLGPVAEELLSTLEVDQGVYFDNRGQRTVSGVQAAATWRHEGFGFPLDVYANYTYTDPKEPSIDAEGRSQDLRTGDIASHRFNLGLEAIWNRRWSLSLRMNYVGARQIGEGTTTASGSDEIEAYTVANSALGYRKILPEKMFSEASLQLVVNNLFDQEYDHPGVQSASGPFAARLPQPGRTVFLRFSTKLRTGAQ